MLEMSSVFCSNLETIRLLEEISDSHSLAAFEEVFRKGTDSNKEESRGDNIENNVSQVSMFMFKYNQSNT